MTSRVPVILLVVLIAVVAGGVGYWLKPSTDVDVRVVIERIRQVAQLATTEYTLTTAVEREFTSKGVLERFRSDYVIQTFVGKVRGYVDLDKMDVERLDKQLVITFRRGSVLVSNAEPVPGETKTLSCAQMLPGAPGKPATPTQVTDMVATALEQMKAQAIEHGIVEKTIERARAVLSAFVETLGYTAEISFDQEAYVKAE